METYDLKERTIEDINDEKETELRFGGDFEYLNRDEFESRIESEQGERNVDVDESKTEEKIDSLGQLVMERRGGSSEDWKRTWTGNGERFDGKELIGEDGSSLTEKIRNSPNLSEANILSHEALLKHFIQSPEEPYLLPDWIEKTPEAEIIHITVAQINHEGNVSYETWSHEEKKEKEEGEVLINLHREDELVDVWTSKVEDMTNEDELTGESLLVNEGIYTGREAWMLEEKVAVEERNLIDAEIDNEKTESVVMDEENIKPAEVLREKLITDEQSKVEINESVKGVVTLTLEERIKAIFSEESEGVEINANIPTYKREVVSNHDGESEGMAVGETVETAMVDLNDSEKGNLIIGDNRVPIKTVKIESAVLEDESEKGQELSGSELSSQILIKQNEAPISDNGKIEGSTVLEEVELASLMVDIGELFVTEATHDVSEKRVQALDTLAEKIIINEDVSVKVSDTKERMSHKGGVHEKVSAPSMVIEKKEGVIFRSEIKNESDLRIVENKSTRQIATEPAVLSANDNKINVATVRDDMVRVNLLNLEKNILKSELEKNPRLEGREILLRTLGISPSTISARTIELVGAGSVPIFNQQEDVENESSLGDNRRQLISLDGITLRRAV